MYKILTLERSSEIYRAMNGEPEAGQKVTIEEVGNLENAPTFEQFILINIDKFEVFDYAYDIAGRK